MIIEITFLIVLVLFLGVFAQWFAWRLQIPSILLLLGFGFTLGFFVDIEKAVDKDLIFSCVSLGVAIIMLEGSLSLRLNEIRGSLKSVVLLCSLGVLIAWVLITTAIFFIFKVPLVIATLIGAILCVTGPTVVTPLLAHIKAAKKVSAIAKWEGILIDPIGVILAVLVLQVVLINEKGATFTQFALAIIQTLTVGVGLGTFVALVIIWLFRKHLIPDFLHSVSILSISLLFFVISDHFAKESGLLTVTVIGLVLANQDKVSVRHVLEFKENLRVILLSFLFIVLAARIKISQLVFLGWGVLLFLAILIIIIRPVSVLLSLSLVKENFKEKIFLSFLAPRGIVAAAISSLFAIEISEHYSMVIGQDISKANLMAHTNVIAPITFTVIVGTVIFYGIFSPRFARSLKLAVANPQGVLFAGSARWVIMAAKAIKEEGFDVLVVDDNKLSLARARMQGIPTSYANILSVYVTEELELSGLGYFLAVTRNNEVNSIASEEYFHLFGGANIFQLQSQSLQQESSRKAVSHHKRRGKMLFADNVTFDTIANLVAAGGQIKKTTISKNFSYDDFLARYGEKTILLFVIDGNKLEVVTKDTPKPTAGKMVVAFVEKELS